MSVYDTLPIEDMVPPETWELTSLPPIVALEVQQKSTEFNTCIVALEVSDSSHVEASATGSSVDAVCPLALEAIGLIEPHLP